MVGRLSVTRGADKVVEQEIFEEPIGGSRRRSGYLIGLRESL